MSANPFLLNTDDVLGFSYEAYIQKIRAISISSPQSYFDMRAEVLQKVKRDAVSNFYRTLFAVLTEGKDLAGNPIIKNQSGTPLVPGYPSQKTNSLAIAGASEMNSWCEKALEIILPDFNSIASHKLVVKGAGDVIE